ncbi:two component transcriptional regulator, LytTR family [Pedococcus cremeus]|uniref:Two component transcriptional regulator, LytTR family n=1 Tax=Pedococcus cremeus TaxID=587636 RepID=A0A1H9WGP0_9MICO|nr:two component transcriptional regulator, LytTR family [Pedococcus cremeus]
MASAGTGSSAERRPEPASAGGAGGARLRALVVDDELPALEELGWLLRQDDRIGEVRTASSGTEALRALEEGPVDVVFSDINMPGLNGMDLARVIARFAQRPKIVFVTAYDQHAVDAFAVDATDYVMKPVRPDRLAEAVRRVVEGSGDGPEAGAPAQPEDETIPVELGGVTRFISRSQIRYAQAQGDYARLHTDTGSHLVRIPLTTLEERWGAAGFVRIHRSTLVALPHVREVRMEHGRCTVVLDGAELQVSRRHTRELRDRLLRAPRHAAP